MQLMHNNGISKTSLLFSSLSLTSISMLDGGSLLALGLTILIVWRHIEENLPTRGSLDLVTKKA